QFGGNPQPRCNLVCHEPTGAGQDDAISAQRCETFQLTEGERSHWNTLTRTQQKLQCLETPGCVIEDFFAGHHRHAISHRRDIAIWGSDVPPAAATLMRMRGAADAPVVALPPVELIVLALVARHSPVAYLVVREPGRRKQVVHDRVLVSLIVV